jgi:hypothetical protein
VCLLRLLLSTLALKCYECAYMNPIGNKGCDKKKDLKDGWLKECPSSVESPTCGKAVVKLTKESTEIFLRGCFSSSIVDSEMLGKCTDLKLVDHKEIIQRLIEAFGYPSGGDFNPTPEAMATTCTCNNEDGCNSSQTLSASLVLITVATLSGFVLKVLRIE